MPDLALKLRNPLAMFAPAYPEANIETKYKSPLVPLPTNAFIPQRDLDKIPVLEVSHLGIDFGGLTAVDDFNLTIGRTEIAGLIGPNGTPYVPVTFELDNRGSLTPGAFAEIWLLAAPRHGVPVCQPSVATRSRWRVADGGWHRHRRIDNPRTRHSSRREYRPQRHGSHKWSSPLG